MIRRFFHLRDPSLTVQLSLLVVLVSYGAMDSRWGLLPMWHSLAVGFFISGLLWTTCGLVQVLRESEEAS